MLLNEKIFKANKVYVFVILLTQSIVIEAQEAESAAAASGPGAATSQESAGSEMRRPREFYFPRWPERREARRERIPLPPPGPYMSSALTGDSIEEPSFSRHSMPEMKFEPSRAAAESFSPDAPWPSNFDSPHRWEPEDGYNYVNPQSEQQTYSDRQPYSNYAYPVRNWPAVNPAPVPYGGYRW